MVILRTFPAKSYKEGLILLFIDCFIISKEFRMTEGMTTEIKQLVAIGQEKGFLTYKEVNDIMPKDMVSSEKIDDLFMLFSELSIDLVDTKPK